MVEKKVAVDVSDSDRKRLETLFGATATDRVLDLVDKTGAMEAIS